MVIQVQLSDEMWEFLNKNKKRGETFDQVLRRLLKENGDKKNKKTS